MHGQGQDMHSKAGRGNRGRGDLGESGLLRDEAMVMLLSDSKIVTSSCKAFIFVSRTQRLRLLPTRNYG